MDETRHVPGAFGALGRAILGMHVPVSYGLVNGVDVRESEFVADDQVVFIDRAAFVSPRTWFALGRPDLSGPALSEAWITHKIEAAYVRALRRHEDRCDRLEEKAEERERARRYSAFDVPIPQEFVRDYLGAWIGNRQQTPDATY